MASSEIMDSAKFSGQKSHFSQTCSLLSQYLKEKGSFGDLTLGIQRGAPAATMDLLPMIEKSGESNPQKPMNLFPAQSQAATAAAAAMKPEKAQMTIFYGGQVVVFNDFPADKAKEIMMLASKGSKPVETGPNLVTPAINRVPSFGNGLIARQPADSDLPIARRASLTRFLEKRKDRLTTKAPYPVSNYPKQEGPSKVEESKAWLGLGAQFPVKTEL